MDSCLAVEKEIDRVIHKFSTINEHSKTIIGSVLDRMIKLHNEISQVPEGTELPHALRENLRTVLNNAKMDLQTLTTDHRELHGTVSKVGKAIDRNFEPDYNATTRNDVFASERNTQLLNTIIAQHFYRQGMDEVANTLVQESNIATDDISVEPFAKLHKIWEAINNRDLSTALAWVAEHSAELDQKRSALEFKLHRLAFIELQMGGGKMQTEAVNYAKTFLTKFIPRFQKEVLTLMGTFLYLPNGIENSIYRDLVAPEMWIEAADTFIKDACIVLDINKDSPLSVVVNAGCVALPALLNLKQVMATRQVMSIWTARDELPIEIDLEPENRYHSVFSCPILRQQSTEDNPPMKLVCGHVISRDALNKLNNGAILKCPYCPMESNPADACLIYF